MTNAELQSQLQRGELAQLLERAAAAIRQGDELMRRMRETAIEALRILDPQAKQ